IPGESTHGPRCSGVGVAGAAQGDGYTLQAVADVLDVSREMVRQRAERVPEAFLVGPQRGESTRAPEPEPLMERPRVRLTDEEVTRAKELMPIAARRRPPTAPGVRDRTGVH